MRNQRRKVNLDRLGRRAINAPAGVVFIDIVNSFEKMGDHSFNVVEATAGVK